MGTGRVRLYVILGAALVVALGLAFVARTAATPRPVKIAPVPVAAPQVQVLVARRDLAVGERIDPAALGWQPWPASTVNAAYIVDGAPVTVGTDSKARLAAVADKAIGAAKTAVIGPDAKLASYNGAVVREHIALGEPVIESKLVRAGAGGVMAVTLQPGMRAMSIPLTPETAAGGFILPGDHVDVVQVRRADGVIASSTVMKNVRVLAIDQNLSSTPAKGSATQVGATATLELAPSQAEDMVLAKAQGDLTLVLRSYADAAGPTNTGVITRASETPPVVRVYRNGVSTDVKVAR